VGGTAGRSETEVPLHPLVKQDLKDIFSNLLTVFGGIPIFTHLHL
jgi:hypothetical protein